MNSRENEILTDSENEVSGCSSTQAMNSKILHNSLLRLRGGMNETIGSPRKPEDELLIINKGQAREQSIENDNVHETDSNIEMDIVSRAGVTTELRSG